MAATRAAARADRILLRAEIVLNDQNGELIAPVVQNGRIDQGMPKFPMTNAQVADIAAFLHNFRVAGYDASRMKPPTILVGDAAAGEAYFKIEVRIVPFGNRRSEGHRREIRRAERSATNCSSCRAAEVEDAERPAPMFPRPRLR